MKRDNEKRLQMELKLLRQFENYDEICEDDEEEFDVYKENDMKRNDNRQKILEAEFGERAYKEKNLKDIAESQGELFEFVSKNYVLMDTEDFIRAYMQSDIRKKLDVADIDYVNLNANDLWVEFTGKEHYSLKKGNAYEGAMPYWIGKFYAYFQWYYNLPSAVVLEKVPIELVKLLYLRMRDMTVLRAVCKSWKYLNM